MTTAVSALAKIESILQADLLEIAGPVTLTFLQSIQTIAANLKSTTTPSTAQMAEAAAQANAAWVTFVAGLLGSLPNLGATLIGQLTAFLISKLQAPTPAV